MAEVCTFVTIDDIPEYDLFQHFLNIIITNSIDFEEVFYNPEESKINSIQQILFLFANKINIMDYFDFIVGTPEVWDKINFKNDYKYIATKNRGFIINILIEYEDFKNMLEFRYNWSKIEGEWFEYIDENLSKKEIYFKMLKYVGEEI